MQAQELAPNGIDRFLKGQSVILQVFKIGRVKVEKSSSSIQLITAAVSDGYAYYQSVYLFPDSFPNDKIQFNVVKLRLTEGIVKKLANGGLKQMSSPLTTNSSDFVVVVNTVSRLIGSPLPYDKYVMNGRKNPNGSRKIFYPPKQQQDTQDDLFQQASNARTILQQKKHQQKKQVPKPKNQIKKQQSKQNPRQTNSRNNSVSKTNQSTNQQKLKPKPVASKPIVKTDQNEQKRVSIKPEVKHHQGDHQQIKSLFLGMQNFKIVARLLFIWPIKMITNKKGNQSQLLNMQFGDGTGTIMCTVFGDQANRFSTLNVDSIFGVTGASLTQSTFKGVTELKLIFNDSTQITIQKNVPKTFPGIQKFCLSLKELNQTEKGKTVSVICMVKQNQLVQFVSKNGNNIKRKTLKLFDLDHQLQCQLTLFNQKAEIKYEPGMYALKGVEVDQFQGNKQFKGSLIFIARYLKNHPLNGKSIQQLQFTNLSSNHKPKKQSIASFYQLNQRCQSLNVGQNIWSETLCYLKAIRLGGNSKSIYLSCPLCKKKIVQQDATTCPHCKKDIDRPKYRYILNVNLIDDHDNIWVGVYDDVGQALLALPNQKMFPADSFAQMSQQQLRQRVQQIRYKQIKAKIVSSKQQYNNEVRVKHKIVKLLPINYSEQIKLLLQKIKSATIV